MLKMVLSFDRCKQCGICVANCPKQALKIGDVFNAKGYLAVVVDEAKCVKCTICHTVCPDIVFEFIKTGEGE